MTSKTRTAKLTAKKNRQSGFSFVELLIVIVLIGILSAIAIPQLISSRRALRAAAVPRVIFTELRQARQQAMGQQQPITVIYSNNTKTLKVFGGSYGARDNARNKNVTLAGNGLAAADIVYGIPAGLPIVPLDDGTSNAPLPQNGEVTLTFRPDGSLRLPDNSLQNYALFIYNEYSPSETATAISILGASGRVKLWRYNSSATKFTE